MHGIPVAGCRGEELASGEEGTEAKAKAEDRMGSGVLWAELCSAPLFPVSLAEFSLTWGVGFSLQRKALSVASEMFPARVSCVPGRALRDGGTEGAFAGVCVWGGGGVLPFATSMKGYGGTKCQPQQVPQIPFLPPRPRAAFQSSPPPPHEASLPLIAMG